MESGKSGQCKQSDIPTVKNIDRNEIAQRIFKYSDIQYTSLTVYKKPNSLIYRTLFYVNIYGSYKLSKNSLVVWPTL